MTTKPNAAATATTRAEARARCLTRYFTGKACPQGHIAERLTGDGACIACTALRTAARRANPKKVAHDNEKSRIRMAERRKADPGPARETDAAHLWRKATGGSMPGWYERERKALQRKYGALLDGFEADHAVPKIAKDPEGVHVASGLHCWANVAALPKTLNGLKRNQFGPDTNRAQRPANRFPGGAFDPTPTEHEQSLIRQAEALGTPAAESLAALQESLDAKAREQEQHSASLF